VRTLFRIIPVLVALLVSGIASAAPSPTGLTRQVLREINLARTDPHSYAGFLREFRRQFRGNSFYLPGSRELVITDEGVAAVDDAIRVLDRQQPLLPLTWSSGLARAAMELVRDGGTTGEIGHTGRRSGGMKERVERHGTWQGGIGENISYGYDEARLVVMQLIVDDGVPDRGHRNILFNNTFGTAGVACGPHPVYGSMCVIDFAGSFHK